MSTGFQMLCESAPLATMMMAFALFWLRRRRSSATRSHLVVMAACVISLAAPLLITVLPKWRVLPSLSSTTSVDASAPRHSSSRRVGVGIATGESYPLWFRLAGGTWLAGSAFCLAACALRQVELRRLLTNGPPAPSPTLTLAMRLKSRRGIRRDVRLIVHQTTGSPFTCGLWNPYIVLPVAHEKMSFADLRMVLDHEMAHIQRLDALHGWILQGFLAMWWFHPLAWLTFRHAEVIKEQACDDLVLLSGEDPARYAACLGEAVLRAHRHPSSLAMVSNFVRKAPQLARMHAILDPSLERSHPTSWETLSVCAPATLAAVIVSSLGFKAASELQSRSPALLSSEPGTRIPSLWSDALEPIARSAGIVRPQLRVEHQDALATDAQNLRQIRSLPPIAEPSHVTHLKKRFPTQAHKEPLRSTHSGERNHSLSEVVAGTEKPDTASTQNLPVTVGNHTPWHAINSVGGNSPISAGRLSADPVLVAASVAANNGNSEAYGYVAMDDAGVMVYSGINRSTSAENPTAAEGSTIVVDHGVIVSDSPPSVIASNPSASEPDGTPLDQGITTTDSDAPRELLIPEDIGIRNLQASIAKPGNGGYLSVSVEVPEQTANFWTAEASADAKFWTNSEDVISHEISSGTSPGFLLLRASLLEPVPSARHTQIRLRGKW